MASDQLKGVAVATAGVLALTPDSLLIRLIHTDAFTLLFFRGLLLFLSLAIFVTLASRGKVVSEFRGIGWTGALAASLLAGSTICFVLAVRNTLVANVLIIVGAAPLFAALFSRHFLSERVHLRTWLAICVALGGIGITVSASVSEGHLAGDLFALGTACFISAQLTTLRRAGRRSMTPSVALAGLIAAIAAAPLASPATVSVADAGWLILLGAVVLPVSFTLIAAGPRYIPAPEVSLLMLMEMVLGPLWVWLIVDEYPGTRALVGGAIVLLTVTVHACVGLRQTAT